RSIALLRQVVGCRHQRADLLAHPVPHLRGVAEVYAGVDASVGYLLYEILGMRPAASDAGRGIAGRAQHRQRLAIGVGAKQRYDGCRDDAVSTRVFWVHRRDGRWRPIGITLGLGVVILIPIADGR